jgi:hypothetical protein
MASFIHSNRFYLIPLSAATAAVSTAAGFGRVSLQARPVHNIFRAFAAGV